MTEFTIPGISEKDGNKVADLLQKQLSTYNDLHLTLKHVHWNVVGPNFIGVHEMIDPQVELVRGYADDVAERIAALGKSPQGTPARFSRTAPGTTTPWTVTPCRRTWRRSTSSTPA
jgi:starvation-inducible DNA-binding protein